MAITYEQIATYTATATTSSITLSNIPQTYTDLHVRVSARSTHTGTGNGIDFLYCKLNNNSSSHTMKIVYATGISSDMGGFLDTQPPYIPMPTADATANTFSNGRFYIAQYTSSNTKMVKMSGGMVNKANSEYRGYHGGSISPETNAITSLVFSSYRNASIAAKTTIQIYGIKKA
jgi:hypothetical protein